MLWFSKKTDKNTSHSCKNCSTVTDAYDFANNNNICPKCGQYERMTAGERINLLIDRNTFNETDADMSSKDFLNFFDGESTYDSKIKTISQQKHLTDAVRTGKGRLNGTDVYIACMDFNFMGGSMGSVVGEKITRTIERATKDNCPVIIVSASGGARMQEGIVSLMQMAKTSAALERHSEAGLLYVSVLTNPTTGGVSASFAMLGDFNIAEPKALIGFAGPRVISQVIKQKLPDGFQRSEFIQEHGFIDMICERNNLKHTISKLIGYAS